MSDQDNSAEHEPTIERLEKDLESEREKSAKLRQSLENLENKIAEVQAQFEQRLEDVQSRARKAESKLVDQSARLNLLGAGREESMRELKETRAELKRVASERDRLQKQLTDVEDMQTETIALPEEEDDPESLGATQDALPTIDELMANLNTMIEESGNDGRRPDLGQQLNESQDGEWQEMIAPELIAPERFIAEAERGSADSSQRRRLLVYLGSEHPIKYPLYKEVMTIGRADSADIQIEGDFISRVHARIVSTEEETYIEDAGSKNGIKLNSEHVERHVLEHGDIIGFGKLRFTFVDSGADSVADSS